MGPFKIKPHHWTHWCLPIPICASCGLLALKNSLSRWCVEKGCDYAEHPEYQRQVKKGGYGFEKWIGSKR